MKKITEKQIETILKKESGIILLKKDSEHIFSEAIVGNFISIFSAIFFLMRKKSDFIILTAERVILIVRNKIVLENRFNSIKSIRYNSMASTLEIDDQNQKFSFSLNRFRINQEESQNIRTKLNKFINQNK